jgi:hypothetical protein
MRLWVTMELDKFVKGIEYCAQELPNIINGWDKLDYELREEYADQVHWMLDNRNEVMKSSKDFTKILSCSKKIETAVKTIYIHEDFLNKKMGINVDEVELNYLNRQIEFYQSIVRDTFVNIFIDTSEIEDEIARLDHEAAMIIRKRVDKNLDKLNDKIKIAVLSARELLKR